MMEAALLFEPNTSTMYVYYHHGLAFLMKKQQTNKIF